MGRIGRCCGRNARLTRAHARARRAVSPTANPAGVTKEACQLHVRTPDAAACGASGTGRRELIGSQSSVPTPALTALKARDYQLNLLADQRTSVTGTCWKTTGPEDVGSW